jgi:hypothetical protein
MKTIRFAVLFALLANLLVVFSAQAQSEALTISFSRDFGYSSGGGDIQGLFTITVGGPETLTKVVFYIDDQIIGEDDAAPFKLQFNTDNYPLGQHKVYAIGVNADGSQLKTRIVNAKFVSASEGWQAALRIAGPVLGIALLAVLAAAIVPLATGRRTVALTPGEPRSYPLGGAICPKCQRPFAVHIYGLNLLTGKYDRCPYCGKWSMVKFASSAQLRAAEQAEIERANEKAQVPGMTEEEKLKKELDESRFHDA